MTCHAFRFGPAGGLFERAGDMRSNHSIEFAFGLETDDQSLRFFLLIQYCIPLLGQSMTSLQIY